MGSGGGFFAKMKEITACFYIYENELLEGKIDDARIEKGQLLEQCPSRRSEGVGCNKQVEDLPLKRSMDNSLIVIGGRAGEGRWVVNGDGNN